jgi:hypothetical protein
MSQDKTVILIQTSRFSIVSRGGLPPFPTVRALPPFLGTMTALTAPWPIRGKLPQPPAEASGRQCGAHKVPC